MATIKIDESDKAKSGFYDWEFVDDPSKNNEQGGVSAIPAHGNHPVFESGGAVIIPKEVKAEERRLNRGSTGKKYFFT